MSETGVRATSSYGAMNSSLPLRIVDGRRLEKRYRDCLRPGGMLSDSQGQAHVLPRYFYEVPSWETALKLQLSEHFALWEFIHTDVHEAEPLRSFPRYVPCAITLLALGLVQAATATALVRIDDDLYFYDFSRHRAARLTAGKVVMSDFSCKASRSDAWAMPRMRTGRSNPTLSSVAQSKTAAAPSLICEALPAVIVPPSVNAGLSPASVSSKLALDFDVTTGWFWPWRSVDDIAPPRAVPPAERRRRRPEIGVEAIAV